MKFKIGWTFLLPILFLSCGPKVTQQYLSQQFHWFPVKDSTGQIIKNVPVYDTMLKMEPGFSQKVSIARHDGTLKWAIILVLIAIGLIVWGIIYSSGAGKFMGLPVVAFCTAILLCCGAAATINWGATKEVEIPKVLHDSLLNTPNGLKPFWDQHLFQ